MHSTGTSLAVAVALECHVSVAHSFIHSFIAVDRCSLDLMLEWVGDEDASERQCQPVVLEMNFSPDCIRACNYDPNFYNNVFSALFLSSSEYNGIHPSVSAAFDEI